MFKAIEKYIFSKAVDSNQPPVKSRVPKDIKTRSNEMKYELYGTFFHPVSRLIGSKKTPDP